MQYLWQFYLLIGLVFVQGTLLLFNSKATKNLFLWLCYLELIFIAGFRAWDIGNDTPNYISTFSAVVNHLDLYLSHMEKGYLLYNKFLSLFASDPQAILISNAIIIVGGIGLFCRKYSTSIFLSILLFGILQFSSTLNIMRQYLALAIVLSAVPFIVKRQFIAFGVCCAIAATFHTSAALAIGLYFLYSLNFKFKHLVWISVGVILSFIFLAPILDHVISITGRYAGYKGNILLGEEMKTASIVKTLVQLSITVFCLFSYRFVYKKKPFLTEKLPIPFLLFCCITATALQFISIRGTVLERLVLYFSIFNLISIPFFICCYPKKVQILVAASLLGCFIVYHSVIFVYRPEWNYVLPFVFCF